MEFPRTLYEHIEACGEPVFPLPRLKEPSAAVKAAFTKIIPVPVEIPLVGAEERSEAANE